MAYLKDTADMRPHNYTAVQQDAPCRENDVPAALGLMRMDLDDLSRNVGNLLQRLAPVIRDETKAATQEAKGMSGCCPLSRELHILRDAIRALDERVREATSQIEL